MQAADLSRAQWRKSSRSSANGACVEVARVGEAVALRDSKNPRGPVLALTEGDWNAFIGGVKNGEFDRA